MRAVGTAQRGEGNASGDIMKATSITIKYDTGQLDVADGDRAAQIMAWWASCEMFARQHGATYIGPRLKHIGCITQDEAVPGTEIVIAKADTQV
jgi:hypothetical protein